MNILLINLHSALNLGDDAIMTATLNDLEKAFPGSKISAAANDPDSWKKFDKVKIIQSMCNWVGDCRHGYFRKKVVWMPVYLFLLVISGILYRLLKVRFTFGSSSKRQLLQAFYDADIVLSCGGGNFYAFRSISPALIWGLIPLGFASWMGKQTVMLPQSVGPIDGKMQKFLARAVFNRVNKIMVRESISKEYLINELHVIKPIIIIPDLAFALPNSSRDITKDLVINHPGINIGVTLINWGAQEQRFSNQNGYEQSIIRLLEYLSQFYNANIHIFSQCTGPSIQHDDRIVTNRVYRKLNQKLNRNFLHNDFQNAMEIKNAYCCMDIVIGTRMHTAIFALSCGIPVVMIGYQPKTLGVMKLFDLQKYSCSIDEISSDILVEHTLEILLQMDALRQKISSRYLEIKHQLEDWPRLLDK